MVKHLVSSAACGADILALEVCEELGIETTIVLPFVTQEFRRISVTDRGGNWGSRFDQLIESNRAHGALIELGLPTDTTDAFEQANIEIVLRASQISAAEHLAVIVWEGAKKGTSDATKDVKDRAVSKGFRVVEINTLLDT
ncbi:hypothetical protein A9Q95_14735 [Rhodobacterales bacterium 59_46_T64]|nr:hypothetical protein A9Q95_14735 [Rhodobacterales bacterium 59_46_T64]